MHDEMPTMEEMQLEIEQRLTLLNDTQRRRVSFMLLTMLRCFGVEAPREAVLISSNSERLEIVGVNSEVPNTVSLVTTAFGILRENYGTQTDAEASTGYLQ
jgi:hypothetical protein